MEKLLLGVKVYTEKRDKLIDEVINLVKIVYPKDREMLSGSINLTSSLLMADPDMDFINGMLGFMNYCSMNDKITASSCLTTLLHDLGEFSRNRHEPWFSPRTSRYGKYITGASEVEL